MLEWIMILEINQDKFDNNEVDIIVATTAFGMGIDKADIRYVLHYDLPKDLESYYQQMGRVGRDVQYVVWLLLFNEDEDIRKIRWLIKTNKIQKEKIRMETMFDKLLRFIDDDTCRHAAILKYFGETYENDRCEMCDICC